MLENLDIYKILFLDIETVSQHPDFSSVEEQMQSLWEEKSRYIRERNELSIEESYERAGIYAEFGKIICVSVGFLMKEGNDLIMRSKSFYGDDEKQILLDFSELLNTHYNGPEFLLCAHNGKEFDYPYLCRRMVVHGVKIPYILNLSGKKPWEVQHLDTMQLWKFGDYKNYTSLKLLTHILNIPSPKEDIDGSDVGRVFWQEKDPDRIEEYCRRDVQAMANVLLRYLNLPLISTVQNSE